MNQFQYLLVDILQLWEIQSFFAPEKLMMMLHLCAWKQDFGVYTIYFGVYIESKGVKFALFWIFMTFLVLHVFTKNIEKTEFQTSTHSSAKITKLQNGPNQASNVAVPIRKRSSIITFWDRNWVESSFIGKGVATPHFRDKIHRLIRMLTANIKKITSFPKSDHAKL